MLAKSASVLTALGIAISLALGLCSAGTPATRGAIARPLIEATAARDARARFREIFCALLGERPDRRHRTCAQLLHRLPDEAPDTLGRPLPAHDTSLRLLFVPGLLSDCVPKLARAFDTAIARLRGLGYSAEMAQINGRASPAFNAALIAAFASRQALTDNARLVLVGHSKGAVDILEFLTTYPVAAARVVAVVSVDGTIGGSLLADATAGMYEGWLDRPLKRRCPGGDGAGLRSLRPATRQAWLATHPLPKHVRYFSLASFTDPDQMSAPLRPFAAALAKRDPLNDGQILVRDQIIPGATILGFANADHLGVAVPIEERQPALATFVTGHNWFPRELLMEAVVLLVAEQLASAPVAR